MEAKIVVHGGAGFWRRDVKRGREGVQKAASAGSKVLADGGCALDAVEAAVSVMEDDPIFNAGTGSALTCVGTVEMDAAIMDGRNLSAGAVALIRNTKNPIHLARVVMENTDHVLLAGKTAEKLGKAFRLPTANPITARRRKAFNETKKDPRVGRFAWLRKNPELIRDYPGILGHDTVGAVAVDKDGNYASAASTGGMAMKLPGRIGDTPLIGSGLYSDNQLGTATATGWGEIAVKLSLSRTVCLMMGDGLSATKAAETCVQMASERLRGHAGIIAIDRMGKVAAVHNTAYMPWAYSTPSMKLPRASFRGRIVSRLR
ncbi:MAG TPA: isoaspartyl peptidase/L-asparaginase [Candidatus Acidoferrales bacterium]|nr:isoaspartyl peptidase/L-asparaginase [Candidatus Acidoferrales bacterium]